MANAARPAVKPMCPDGHSLHCRPLHGSIIGLCRIRCARFPWLDVWSAGAHSPML